MACSAHLLFASTLLILSCSFFNASGLEVLDTAGKPVSEGNPYILRAVTPSDAGNVTMVHMNPSTGCPNRVGLTGPSSDAVFQTYPVYLIKQGSHPIPKFVVVGEQLKLKFVPRDRCTMLNSFWGLVRANEQETGVPDVVVPWSSGNNLAWFVVRFDEAEKAYYLEHCNNDNVCFEVGWMSDGADRILITSTAFFPGKFRFVFDNENIMGSAGQFLRSVTSN